MMTGSADATAATPNAMAEPVIRQLASNRRARHDYDILDAFEAGLVLTGTEVKAARQGKVQLRDGYVELRDGEAYLVGAHFSHYSHGNRENHEPDRPRKLLLSRRQLNRLFGRTTAGKSTTIIPLRLYLKGNWIKVEIALAQGKKLYDKREAERKREMDREMEAAMGRVR